MVRSNAPSGPPGPLISARISFISAGLANGFDRCTHVLPSLSFAGPVTSHPAAAQVGEPHAIGCTRHPRQQVVVGSDCDTHRAAAVLGDVDADVDVHPATRECEHEAQHRDDAEDGQLPERGCACHSAQRAGRSSRSTASIHERR